MTITHLGRKLALRKAAQTELKACPFCGGEAKLNQMCAWAGLPAHHFVGCLDCGASTRPMFAEVWIGDQHVAQDSAKLAVERWNLREPPKPPTAIERRPRTGLAPRKD